MRYCYISLVLFLGCWAAAVVCVCWVVVLGMCARDKHFYNSAWNLELEIRELLLLPSSLLPLFPPPPLRGAVGRASRVLVCSCASCMVCPLSYQPPKKRPCWWVTSIFFFFKNTVIFPIIGNKQYNIYIFLQSQFIEEHDPKTPY